VLAQEVDSFLTDLMRERQNSTERTYILTIELCYVNTRQPEGSHGCHAAAQSSYDNDRQSNGCGMIKRKLCHGTFRLRIASSDARLYESSRLSQEVQSQR
jgi:hypothetical protein